MKIKVNRRLSEGRYNVDFTASDFTSDEVKKMESFGIPMIDLFFSQTPNSRLPMKIQLTKLTSQLKASFSTEQEAKDYEDKVLSQIRAQMKALRERKDDFSATSEVEV
jgi:hypothetical protein